MGGSGSLPCPAHFRTFHLETSFEIVVLVLQGDWVLQRDRAFVDLETFHVAKISRS